MNIQRYQGKTVVITGAAAGLGRALALGYAREGASLILLDIAAQGLAETAALVQEAGQAATVWEADLAREEEITRVAQAILARFPRIHVLYNNAGLAYGEVNAMIDTVSMARWQFFLAVNTLAPLLLAQALRPALAAAARESGAAIINQSSMAAYMPATVYGVTKSALNQITYGMAHLLGADGIRVNAIAPGLMETPASTAALPEDRRAQLQAGQMLPLHGTADDIVDLGLFLASDAARFITAEVMHCDAGHRLRGWRE